MKIINNSKEFKEAYYYKSPPNPDPCPKKKEYPKKYPCILEYLERGGGLAGEWIEHKIIYFPNRVNKKSFLMGYKEGVKQR